MQSRIIAFCWSYLVGIVLAMLARTDEAALPLLHVVTGMGALFLALLAVRRLRRISTAMQSAKEIHNAVPASLLQDFSKFASPAVAAQAARTVARLRLADRMAPLCNVVISNVPGPRETLYLAGAELTALIPVSTVGDGMAIDEHFAAMGGWIRDMDPTRLIHYQGAMNPVRDPGFVDVVSRMYPSLQELPLCLRLARDENAARGARRGP